jgi:vacuolar-type H+-ATPase catalytic subunit A/Vma1
MSEAVENGVNIEKMESLVCKESLARMKTIPNDGFAEKFEEIEKKMDEEISNLCQK